MTNEQILSWMITFGMGWVDWDEYDRWYMGAGLRHYPLLHLRVAEEEGMIEIIRSAKSGFAQYRLTPKAIAQLEGETDDQRTNP